MSIITMYPGILNVSGEDLLIISDLSIDGHPTRTVSVSELSTYIGGGGGTGLVDSVNTTNGTFISLTPISPAVGDVVVTADISATGLGTPNSNYFLRGDNTWAIPGGIGTVYSVGITETGSALTITNSPITSGGNINIAGAGSASQVILGNLTLGTLTSGTVTNVAYSTDIAAFTAAVTNPTNSAAITLNLNGGTVGQFLRQDGTWAMPSGGVTSIIAGTNVTISPVNGLGDVTINAGASVTDLSATLPITVSAAVGSVDIGVNAASSIALGVVQLPFATAQTIASNSPTATASRTYPVQYYTGTNKLVVNVPWTSGYGGWLLDTDTSGTTFNVTDGLTVDFLSGTGITPTRINGDVTHTLDDTLVTPGPYTNANITVDAQGRITAATDGSSGITSITSGAGITATPNPITSTGSIAVDYLGLDNVILSGGSLITNAVGSDYILLSENKNNNCAHSLISDLPGYYTNFFVAADTGSANSIGQAETLTLTGGDSINTATTSPGTTTISLAYKSVVLRLVGNGSLAPTFTVVQNDLGSTIAITRSGTGDYVITTSGGSGNFGSNVIAFIENPNEYGISADVFPQVTTIRRKGTTEIAVRSFNVGTGTAIGAAGDLISAFEICAEIRVYP